MGAIRDVLIGVLVVIASLFVLFVFSPMARTSRSFARIEQEARQVITAAELQTWGTNLVAHEPPGHVSMENLGTNFPSQLTGVFRHPPFIVIYEALTNDNGHVEAGWVSINWGSGFLGHCGFEIGPTNFDGRSGGDKWADGVYFFRGR